MPWARLDDRFHDNRKVRRVWRKQPAALGLHIMAITYSSCHLLDGHVDTDWLEDQVPSEKRRTALTSALVDAGLWTPNGDGFVVNDYLEFNPSRADVEKLRAEKREAGRRGGIASGASRRGEAHA
ncbi:MAG: hypothetical protein KGL39_38575 [Patescibacteria group bacterium]|nr:hypothetical protein [Patescibacteria group bacterium]